VHPSFPATTVPELIAYAKANPGKINMASTGTGNLSHLSGELFKMMTGTDMLHVPYRGAPAAEADLLSGRVQLMFDTIPAAIVYVRDGRLRALAVSTATRLEVLPDIPTVGESVPGFEISGAVGIGAPKDTPVEVIDKLNKDINAVLAEPQLTSRFSDLGATVQSGSPADFGRFIAVGTEKWAKVIAFANITAE
jgi:tripartite-type tricarboxylate transporter receptor subunit TctC